MRNLGPGLPPILVLGVFVLAIIALVFWIMTGAARAF